MEETKNENSVSVVEQKNEEKLVKKKEWLDTQIMNQRWKLAQIYANSQCVPSKFQGKPNDCTEINEILKNEIRKNPKDFEKNAKEFCLDDPFFFSEFLKKRSVKK